jgi:hypothetical protein
MAPSVPDDTSAAIINISAQIAFFMTCLTDSIRHRAGNKAIIA